MQAKNYMSFLTQDQQLSQSLAVQSAKEFTESTNLIVSNIFGLFCGTTFQNLFQKSVASDTFSDLIKKNIIYYSKRLDYSKVLSYLQELTKEQCLKVGQEFFYVTGYKFAKNQSIESFAKFFFVMTKSFGFDGQFFRKFMSNDRDYTEVLALFEHITQWDQSIIEVDINVVLFNCLIIALEKFAFNIKLEDFYTLLSQKKNLLQQDNEKQETNKIMMTLVQNILAKNFGNLELIRAFEYFENLGVKYTINLLIDILNLANHNQIEEDVLNKILDFFKEKNISFDIEVQNQIIDFYCSKGDFLKAYEIFEQIKQDGLEPNNFTYSNLLKGMKNSRNPDIELALKFLKSFNESHNKKDVLVYNTILDLFLSFGEIEKAFEIFKDMKSQDDFQFDHQTFNVLIKGCSKQKDFEHAMIAYNEMKKQGIKPNRITYNTLMDICVKVEKMKEALKIVEEMQQDNLSPDAFTYSIILNGLKINNSNSHVVRNSLNRIYKVVQNQEILVDEVFFNSVLDVCHKYEFSSISFNFHNLMKQLNVNESSTTYGILIKCYSQAGELDKAFDLFEKMINQNMRVSDITYGCILDACSKQKKMNIALKIYKSLQNSKLNLNSIVFTTIIKGFINVEAYKEAIEFFNEIKTYQDQPGMIITFNCALDVYVREGDLNKALKMFHEIDQIFKADLISYSTIIKGLCQSNKKEQALDYVKRMINAEIEIDVSVINLFLDSCANKEDFKLGVLGYQYAMMKNVEPNEITFGIMVKIYGFARELQKAFDLLDLMTVFGIEASIIIFTNLIHISFYNRNPRKAELAFTLFKKTKQTGDRLMYSKLIDGLIRFKQAQKVPKYVKYALKDGCSLKNETIESIKKVFKSNEEVDKQLNQIMENRNTEKKFEKELRNQKFKNRFNEENPKKYKQMIKEQRQQERLRNSQEKKVNEEKRKSFEIGDKFDNKNNTTKKGYNGFKKPKKMEIFNFRRKN